MPCSIRNLEDLIRCLNDAVQGEEGAQFIEFGAGMFEAAGEFVGHLQPGATHIRIDQRRDGAPLVQPEPPDKPTEVRVVGVAALFVGGRTQIDYDVVITGTVPNEGEVDLVLEAKPSKPEEWSFAANFAEFPDYYGADGFALAWRESFFNDIAIEKPTFRVSTTDREPPRGLTLTGRLYLDRGPLAVLKSSFPVYEDGLPFSGSIRMRSERYPIVDFRTEVLKDYSIERMAQVRLRFGTRDEVVDGHEGESFIDLVTSTTVASIPLNVRAPLLQGNSAWVIEGSVEDPEKYSLASGLSALVEYAGGKHALTLPAGLDAFASLHLAGVTLSFTPTLPPQIQMIGFRVAVGKDVQWTAPILGLGLRDLAIEWLVLSPFDNPSLIGSVSGTLLLGTGADAPRLRTQIDLTGLDTEFAPDVAISAWLDPEYPIRIDALFKQLTGLELGLGLKISDLLFEASTGSRSLQFTATLEGELPFKVPLVEFEGIDFLFRYAPNGYSGSVLARVDIAGFGFFASADYRGEGQGWLFKGGLRPDSQGRSLQDLLDAVAGGRFPELPANLGAIELRRLEASFDTRSSVVTFDGVVGWPFKFEDLDVDLEAELAFTSKPAQDEGAAEGARRYEGHVRGQLKINDFAVAVVYDFGIEKNRRITFQIQYRALTVTCVYAKNEAGESILRASLGGVSFGDILEYLVNLVDPKLGFRLPAPWDVLYRLRLDDLSLQINLTTGTVGFWYDIKANLGVVDLESIGLTYVKRAGRSTVEISVAGKFFETSYDREDPLTWDLLNDPPPAPPAKADKLLDLRYLGFGQNVTFRETRSFARVKDVMEALEADFLPVDDEQNPLTLLPKLKFSGDGRWLIGADFTVMGAVSLMGVFNDPALYGLRVGLAGPKVKSLSGLEFEILYKKVTDTIGLYHLELTLPQAMRELQFGVVSVTVPIIGIDIYTNGNFRLDLGFPKNLDFSRSFGLQAYVFTGSGGLYFGLLDGATSDAVPAIRNGNFSPVIAFGLGLSIGVGRTINKGVLSAGATLSLTGIVEGAFAWFNPNDAAAPTDIFYHVEGTVGIVGKVFGAVDFAVVKVNVDIVLYATVTLSIESYAPIDVQLEVGVKVAASVKILFIRVTFSFEATLDLSFRIGDAGNPPWLPAAEESVVRPFLLRQQRTRYRPRVPRPIEVLRQLREQLDERPRFDWTPRRVGDDDPQPVDVLLMPSLTPAMPSKVTASLRDGTAAATGAPALQIVMALFVPTATAADANYPEDVVRVEHASPESVPFNLLAKRVFRWAVSSLEKGRDGVVFRAPENGGETVTIAHLDAIAEFLADRWNRDATFTYERVKQLVGKNFVLRISNPIGPTGGFYDPGSDQPRDATAALPQAAIFPMIPEIEMAPEDRDPVRFWEHACISAAYREFLDTYYDELRIDAGASVARDPLAARAGTSGPTGIVSSLPPGDTPAPGRAEGLEPLSAVLFADYFAMIAQQSIHAAIDLMNAYPYEPTGEESLADIVGKFGGYAVEYRTRRGDTLGTVAAAFGVSIAELRRNNSWLTAMAADTPLAPASTLRVELGPTVAKVTAANKDYPLNSGAKASLTIRGVLYQVRDGETLGKVARAFALSDVAELLTGEGAAGNADNLDLLAAGVPFRVPQFKYTVREGDVIAPDQAFDRIAARFYTRSRLRKLSPEARARIDWYIGAISEKNPRFEGTIAIPVAELRDGQVVDTGRVEEYVVLPSDTLQDVAAAFELIQLDAGDPGFRAFRDAIQPRPPIKPGMELTIPSFPFPVRSGDTFRSIAELFFLPATPDDDVIPGALAVLARANADANVLVPRAVLRLPTFRYPIAPGDTLGTVAERFDLTIEELAESVAADVGVFAKYVGDRPRMIVPDVTSRDLGTLACDLIRFGSFNTLSTTVSRYLLHGMRAPLPDGAGNPTPGLWGLYDVVGQQFPAPTGASPYTIRFSKRPDGDWEWFTFDPPPGKRASASFSDGAEELTVTLPAGFIKANAPNLALDPMTVTGPMPMRLYDLVAPRYGFERSIHWQTATEVPLPGPTATGPTGPVAGAAGQPSIWPFPESLKNRILEGSTGITAGTSPYELIAARPTTGGGTAEKSIMQFAWATAIPLRITRARDDRGEVVPNTYQIVGADQDGRELLLRAWSYLATAPAPGDRLYLLYPPSAAAANDGGLVSDAIDPTRTFLLKTNLSTETHSNVTAMGVGAGEYYAGIDSPGAFLKFVWEASITGTGGFYLHYAGGADGRGFPIELFANGDTVTIRALLILDRQRRPYSPERGLFPFNNCAVIGENLDASAVRVYARLVDPTPHDLRRVASVPPGVVGFALARRNPNGATGPTALTQELHSLVGYRVTENADFAESNEGLPVGPRDADKLNRLALPATDGPYAFWVYEQTVPIARFGKHIDGPSSPALPPASASPYRGITGPAGPTGAGSPAEPARPLSRARLSFAYHDIYGNETIATAPPGSIEVPVGYTDDLIGPGAWPGSGFVYLFERNDADDGAMLRTELSLHFDRYVPGAGQSFTRAVRGASADAERYRQIFYQVQQRDVAFALESNIGTAAVDGSDLKAALTAFVSGARLFTVTAASLRQVTCVTPEVRPLADVARTLATTPADLVEANKDVDACAFFPGLYVKPHIVPAPAMNTLAGLAGQVVGRFGVDPADRKCDDVAAPAPTFGAHAGPTFGVTAAGFETSSGPAAQPASAGASPIDVAKDNVGVPLTPGVTLRTKERTIALPDFDDVDNTLAAVARWLRCNVITEVANPDDPKGKPITTGLLVLNRAEPNLVAPGVVIRIRGVEYETKQDDTFATIFEYFNGEPHDLKLSEGDFAVAIQDVPGIFRRGESVRCGDFIVPAPAPGREPGPPRPTFALRDMPEGTGSVEELAELNCVVPNFFAMASPVLLGYTCCEPGVGDTLDSLARAAGVTLEQLAFYNEATGVGANVKLRVPSVTYLPEPDASWAAYSPHDASLAEIATSFATDVAALAEVNRTVPGIFRPGAQIKVPGRTITAAALDSLESVCARSGAPSFEAFVQAIAAQGAVFRPGGAFITPLPTVPGSGEATPSFEMLAADLHVEPTSLLEANRSLLGFLRVGAVIHGPAARGRAAAATRSEPATIEVGEYDTIETVLRRLRDECGVDATISDLVEANRGRTSLVAAGARPLLPPNPTRFGVPFTPRIPPDGAKGESAMIFPVEVSVLMTRARGLVHLDFVETPSVYRSSHRLAPQIAKGETATGLSLDAFAARFEEAFAQHRLKCAVTTGSGDDGGAVRGEADPAGAGRIWAVNFGPTGIRRFAVDATRPKFYAVKPLSTEPISGDVPILEYVSGRGLTTATRKRFENVDLDSWMRQFLEAMDLFLTPTYAVPAFRQGASGPTGPTTAWEPSDRPARGPRSESDGDGSSGPVGIASGAPVGVAPSFGLTPDSEDGGPVPGAIGATAPSGPADHERIVRAKYAIAKRLRESVVPIVAAPGATGMHEWEAARETMYQRMLVRLSDAYEVDAVVQFPVDVLSPMSTPAGPTGMHPPRVSGKVGPTMHTIRGGEVRTAPPNSIAAVAQACRVSGPYLAQVIGNMEGLLRPGTVIDGVEVGDRSTLNTIAANRGIPTDPNQPGYWAAWTAWIKGFEELAVFLPDASFPLSRAARAVYGGDSLSTIGEFFGRDVASVGRSNQNVPGILRPGDLTIDEFPKPYVVKPSDTLVDVADGLAKENGKPLGLDDLCYALRDRTDILVAGKELHTIDALPELSLSTAKVSLGRIGALDGPPPPLSFLLSVKHKAERSKLLLNLDFAINEVEYRIRDVPNAGKYQASSWLTIVLPLDSGRGGVDVGADTRVPQVQVPIPLRSYPPPSVLAAQSGLPTFPDTPDLREARRWDYRFDIRTHKAAQDTDHIRVVFGERPNLARLDASLAELFRWLATFVTAYPELKNDLARLSKAPPGTSDIVAAHAVQALSIIAERIASALALSTAAAAGPDAVETYRYRMTTTTDGKILRTLRLDLEEGPTGPSAVWPEIFIKSTTAPTAGTGPDAGFLRIPGGNGFYQYPPDPPGFEADRTQTYRFLFGGRDVIANPNARGGIAISRNDRLIAHGPLGPTGAPGPVPTNPDFVYRTPFVQFVDPTIPLIDNDAAIDLSKLSPGRLPLQGHLLKLFRAAVDLMPNGGGPGRHIGVVSAYGFQLTDADGGLIARTPVLLAPPALVSPADVDAYALRIATSLARWRGRRGVDRNQGLLVFELSVFTVARSQMSARPETADGAPLAHPLAGPTGPSLKPILQLRNLQLPMSAIDWGATGPQGPDQ